MSPGDDGNTELLAALRESETRYREMFENNSAVQIILDPENGNILDVNRAAAVFYGWPREQLRAMNIAQINTLPIEAIRPHMARAKEGQLFLTFQHRTAMGDVRDVEIHSGPVHIRGRVLLYSIISDVTERRSLERQLLIAQRMDAVGRLAGGVAHDFNNLLAVILNYATLLERRLGEGAPGTEEAAEIRAAASRAADLTRQLLIFARRHEAPAEATDVNTVISGMEKLLQRSVGELVELKLDLEQGLRAVRIGFAHLEQVIVNLAVNARDAMPEGGRLDIRTRSLEVDDARARHTGLEPGRFVVIGVHDSGVGMSEDVAAHAFEPFFTTKPMGLGTGLGLAIVYGIVRKAGGHVAVRSSPGAGSAFTITLPASDAEPTPRVEPVVDRAAVAGRGETVLVVEDDDVVRTATAKLLIANGYEVMTCGSGADALAMVRSAGEAVAVVLTDVVMPRMSGSRLAELVAQTCPHTGIVFMTGFTGNEELPPGVGEGRRTLLQKPFREVDLLAALRDAIAAARHEASASDADTPVEPQP